MKIRNVHSRELPVASERVGALIDDLGGANDRLWPTHLWPATPLELDGPLAVGTPSRQGLLPQTQIRQAVAEYEPGKRLVFRFAPDLGIVGTHRLEVKSLGPKRTRLIHTLDCRLNPRMIPVYPLLIRQHDALVEDLLDRAELATTGAIADPARWPVSVRIANAVEERIARRLGKLPRRSRSARGLGRACGVGVPAVLVALAALHAAWALGWRWPGGSDRAFAERVLGSGATEAPPSAASWAVAVGLLGAAVIVGRTADERPSRALRLATWAVSGVFLARGALFIPVDLVRGFDGIYERLDLAIYSPLCLALGGGAAMVARNAARGGPSTASG